MTTGITALAAALEEERARPAPPEKHWYGTTSTLARHYPVRVVLPSFIQVQWSATPGRAAFIERLSRLVRIEQPISLRQDFTNLRELSREQQEQRLRDLDGAGQTVLAVYTARRLYGLDLEGATALLDKLRVPGR